MLSLVVKNLHHSARRRSRTGLSLSLSARPSTHQFSNRYTAIRISSNSHRRNTYAIPNRYKSALFSLSNPIRFVITSEAAARFRISRRSCGTAHSQSRACPSWRDLSSNSSRVQHPASCLENLIANLELEFALSPMRISELRISNRKFPAIFHPESHPRPLASNPQNPYTGPSAEGESQWKTPSY